MKGFSDLHRISAYMIHFPFKDAELGAPSEANTTPHMYLNGVLGPNRKEDGFKKNTCVVGTFTCTAMLLHSYKLVLLVYYSPRFGLGTFPHFSTAKNIRAVLKSRH